MGHNSINCHRVTWKGRLSEGKESENFLNLRRKGEKRCEQSYASRLREVWLFKRKTTQAGRSLPNGFGMMTSYAPFGGEISAEPVTVEGVKKCSLQTKTLS